MIEKQNKKIDWELADKQKNLLQEKYNLYPIEVNEYGYMYNLGKSLKAFKKYGKEKEDIM